MAACPPNRYQHGGLCCHRCPVGLFRSRPCRATTPTTCLPCGEGEYMDSINFMPNCLRCLRCEAGSHLETEQACNRTHNTVCRCRPGHYCHTWQEGRCERCKRVSNCRQGEGVSKAATARSDTQCLPCPSGTFSNVTDAWSPCYNHTVCSHRGHLTLRLGDGHTDTSCTPPSVNAAVWGWPAGLVLGLFLLLLGGLIICRRRRRWQDETGPPGTQQMDQLLQFRMLKVVRETSEEVVESVVDIRKESWCAWDGQQQDLRHLKGLSADNVLLGGRPRPSYIDVVKGSSRSLPQALVYENVSVPALRSSGARLHGRSGPQPPPPGAPSPSADGLETDHPGAGDGGGPASSSGSRARDILLPDGGPRPLSSAAGPPTLTASEIFGQGRLRRDPPPVAVRVAPPTPPPRRMGGDPGGGGPSPGQRGLPHPKSNLQPEEDEWTE